MKSSPSILFCLLALAIGSSDVAAIDRAADHEQRLSGLNLDGRSSCLVRSQRSEATAASVVDLVVSESVAPAHFNQDWSRPVALKDGGWLVAWDDARMGSRKIYWQQYDAAGGPVGDNQLLASSDKGDNYVEPKLAVDTLGRVYLAYRDQTNGLIFAKRYTAELQIDYGPILINDTSLSSFAGPFDMAVFPDGAMVLAWENYSGFGSTIERAVYAASGSIAAPPAGVNTDGGSVNHWVPSVAVAPGSGFLVVWEDYRNGQADIYARQFTGGGVSVGSDFALVPPPDNGAPQYSPRVAFSSKDKYVIGWVDLRSGQEIYLQRYDQTTGLVGGNELISSGQPLVTNQDVELCAAAGELLQVVWSASGADNTIQALSLDSGLVPASMPMVVNSSSLGQRWSPAGCFESSGDYVVVWTEFVGEDADIALMLFDGENDPLLGAELTVNDDQVGAHSTSPCIVPSDNWWNVVCYVDRRNDAGDVYARSISNGGQYGSADNRVNQDAGTSLQSEPHAAVADARSLFVWIDGRTVGGSSGQRIFGRFGSHLAEFSEDEFLISDSAQIAAKASPRVAMASGGQALVGWIDRRDGRNQVYARWLATDGSLDGDEFQVSAPSSDSSSADLQVVLDPSGRFNVLWLDVGLSTPAVKLRRYASNKSLIGSVDYTSGLPGVTIDRLSTDIAPDGSIVLFWVGIDGAARAYLTRLADDGSVLTSPFEITDHANALPSDPSVSVCPTTGFFF